MPYEKTDDKIILQHPKGAKVVILFFGATITSWQASDRGQPSSPTERLFLSSKAALDGSKAVRGGIPVVFPCFGPPEHPDHSKLLQHGFARTEIWTFDSILMDNDAGVSVRLTLQPNPAISKLYTKDFHLAYVVTLTEHELSTDIHVSNPASSETLDFQALLHTYIRAPANEVSITPLFGKRAVDVRTITDAVYEDTPPEINVSWPGGGLALKLSHFTTLTIWNPQEEVGSKIGDMEEKGWERFVCVEPGYVRGFKKLGPGETWIGQQVLVVAD